MFRVPLRQEPGVPFSWNATADWEVNIKDGTVVAGSDGLRYCLTNFDCEQSVVSCGRASRPAGADAIR